MDAPNEIVESTIDLGSTIDLTRILKEGVAAG